MNAEFNWWLLIVGLGAGAAVTWLVLSDLARRDDELAERERADEAMWIADELDRNGEPASIETIARVLEAHRIYLRRDAGPMEAEDELLEIDDDPVTMPLVDPRADPRAETRQDPRAETRQDPRPEVPDPT